MEERERRVSQHTELRVAQSDQSPPKIVGYAARFGSKADLGGFVEQIAPGAFARAIKDRQDVRALFNHDPNYVLGRTAANTLAMREDETGLWIEVTPPDTTWARDLMTSISRGDVSQMSFAFAVRGKDGHKFDKSQDPPVRTLLDVDLFDVSPVTYPAYQDTQVSVRALTEAKEAAVAVQADATGADGDQAAAELARMRLRIAELE